MGRASKLKGANGERELAGFFSRAGFPMKRTGVQGQIRGDLDNDLRFYVECRRRETWAIPAWVKEIAEKTPEGNMGVLAFRRSKKHPTDDHPASEWHVALSLTHFLELLKEARA